MNDRLARLYDLFEVVEDWSKLPESPLVSVHTATYNHEKTIAETIESIITQQTDFPYELVIKEDKSTDRTREIVRDYQRRYPEKIRLFLAHENLYSRGIKPGMYVALRGKYIARLDGDDYWIGSDRLAIMTSFLENNPDYAIAFSNVLVVYDQPNKQPHSGYLYTQQKVGHLKQLPIPNETTNLSDLARRAYIYGPAALFKNIFTDLSLPDFLDWPVVGDWATYLAAALHGDVRYFPSLSACYRVHDGGIWASKNDNHRIKHHFLHYCSLARSSAFDPSLTEYFRANVVRRQISIEAKCPEVLQDVMVQQQIENLRRVWTKYDTCLREIRHERVSTGRLLRSLWRSISSALIR